MNSYQEPNLDKVEIQHRYKITSHSDHIYEIVVPDWKSALEWVHDNFNSERGVKSIERKRGVVQVPKK